MRTGRARTWRAVQAALLAFVCALAVVALPAPAARATGTRYLDPLFAGALDPVVEASYDPAQVLNQHQTLTVAAPGGTYTLSVGGQTTAALAPTATAGQVQAALQALPTVDLDGSPGGDVVVTGGPGGYTGGNQYRITFTDVPSSGTYPRVVADGSALTGGFGFTGSAQVQCDLCLDVYQPSEVSAPATGRPVVVLAHGGGFVGGNKDGQYGDVNGQHMVAWAQQLAALGYVTVSINYTLTDANALAVATCDWNIAPPGAGSCPAAEHDAAASIQHDMQAAVRWLRLTAQPSASGGQDNPYRIDPASIMVVGESAGGFGALNTIHKSDDPGTVGVTVGSSAVSAGVALAGMMMDADQRPGAPPTLLMTFTNDPSGELFGSDMYDMSRRVVARANAVGNLAELASYCRRIDTGAGPQPVHLVPTDQPEFADEVARVTRFLYDHVTGPSPTTSPSASLWTGGPRSTPMTARGGQSLYGHHRAVTGDYDGDGTTDALLYGSGAECDTIWFGRTDHTFTDPKEVTGTSFTPAVDIGGSFTTSVGDVDGDGRADILWYDPVSGATRLWYGNADRTFSIVDFGTFPSGWIAVLGDFDGDGRADPLFYSSSLHGVLVTFSTSTRGTFTGTAVVAPVADLLTPIVGDFDGDGHADIYWHGAAPMVWHGGARAGAATFVQAASLTPPDAAPPQPGDFDGDGRTDLFWYEPAGTSAIWWGAPGGGAGFTTGKSWTIASGWDVSAADFDGDGASDVLWHRSPGSEIVWYGGANRNAFGFFTVVGPDAGTALVAAPGGFDHATSPAGKVRAAVLWTSP